MTHIARSLASGLAAIVLAGACQQLPMAGDTAAGCPVCPACPQCPPAVSREARYEAVEFAALPGWRSALMAPSLSAFLRGCTKVAPAHALRRVCDAAGALPAQDEVTARHFFESEFAAFSIVAPENTTAGLITGYYEPILAGSRMRSATHRYPVYGTPDDLVVVDLATLYPDLRGMRLRGRIEGRRLVPYWSRAEIEGGKPDFSAPVLAWLADPVESFFLQIQGSGQIRLDSGERMRVGYADQNGHPYRSLGRHLVERGELALEHASMQGIKAWALANPSRLQEALNVNASYVFFRELVPEGDPVGALGTALAPGYSVAVDPRYVPLGAPLYLASTYPLATRPLERLVMAHDTGGAIRGAVRADFYWGSGDEAGMQAGRMRQQGRLWLLWPRGVALPR